MLGRMLRRMLTAGAPPPQLHQPPDSLGLLFIFTCSAPPHCHRLNRIGPRQAPLLDFLLSVKKKGLISFTFAYVLRSIFKGSAREMAFLNTDAI